MRHILIIACTAWIMLLGVMPGHAEKRVALVIGNNAYANLPPDQQLRKAVNDARAVGDALERLGAANAPVGDTYVIIGILLFSSAIFIDSIDLRSPPGVLIWMMSACAPSLCAVLIESVR